jgi:hypothetical protein
MTDRFSYRRSFLLAGTFALLTATALPAQAQQPPAPAPSSGMSPLDKSAPAKSNQDTNLKVHATPPTETALEKIPVDKIKLPPGFKAEIWSHGHPGGRTMVMGPKGTVFVGSRVIGRVYAIADKGGKGFRYT